MICELNVHHTFSGGYHPEGALQRFHHFQNYVSTYCVEAGKEWNEGIPFLLIPIQNALQESTGFSSAELVFGQTVQGHLKILHKQWLSPIPPPQSRDVLSYVSSLWEWLQVAKDLRHKKQTFQVGDHVLVFLLLSNLLPPRPVLRSVYSPTDYVIKTPNHNRKSCVCHTNMLKSYVHHYATAQTCIAREGDYLFAWKQSYCPLLQSLEFTLIVCSKAWCHVLHRLQKGERCHQTWWLYFT